MEKRCSRRASFSNVASESETNYEPFLGDNVKEVNLADTKSRKKRINQLKGDQPKPSRIV